MEVSPKPTEVLSMGGLRDNLHHHLRDTGALANLKTQLRAMVLSEVTKSSRNTANIMPGGPKSLALAPSPADATSWSLILANRLVEAHLRNTNKPFSHNIFLSEAGMTEVTGGSDGELCASIDVPVPQPTTKGDAGCGPLVSLVSKVLHNRCSPSHQTTIVQTDSPATVAATDVTLTIEQKLALVDAQHSLRYAHCDHASKATMEGRFKQYRDELETELKKEFEHKLLVFRNKELANVRREEAERYQLLVSHKTQEMVEYERSVQQRMELERARLEATKHDLEVHRQSVDKRGRDLFALAEERERSVAHHEKHIQSQKETIQKLQMQLTQLEDLCSSRAQEAESWRTREHRRTEEMRRIQAEHMSELRIKDEEANELRYKLKISAEEYRHHLDRMSLDVRMTFQNQMANNRHHDPVAAAQYPPQQQAEAASQEPQSRPAYPDYKTLLSMGAPQDRAEPEKEYQVPLHSIAAKYLRAPNPVVASDQLSQPYTFAQELPPRQQANPTPAAVTEIKDYRVAHRLPISSEIPSMPSPSTTTHATPFLEARREAPTTNPAMPAKALTSKTMDDQTDTPSISTKVEAPQPIPFVDTATPTKGFPQQRPVDTTLGTNHSTLPPDNSGLSPIPRADHSRSPSSGNSATSRSPTNSLPQVQRRKSPVLPSDASSRSPMASSRGGSTGSSTKSTAHATATDSPSPSQARRPVLDAQKDAAERRELLLARLATDEQVESDTRRAQYTTEAEERKMLIGNSLPVIISSALRAGEDRAYKAILWSHTSELTRLKSQKESVMVYTSDYGGGGGASALARDSDDSDGGVNIFGGKGSDSDSDF